MGAEGGSEGGVKPPGSGASKPGSRWFSLLRLSLASSSFAPSIVCADRGADMLLPPSSPMAEATPWPRHALTSRSSADDSGKAAAGAMPDHSWPAASCIAFISSEASPGWLLGIMKGAAPGGGEGAAAGGAAAGGRGPPPIEPAHRLSAAARSAASSIDI